MIPSSKCKSEIALGQSHVHIGIDLRFLLESFKLIDPILIAPNECVMVDARVVHWYLTSRCWNVCIGLSASFSLISCEEWGWHLIIIVMGYQASSAIVSNAIVFLCNRKICTFPSKVIESHIFWTFFANWVLSHSFVQCPTPCLFKAVNPNPLQSMNINIFWEVRTWIHPHMYIVIKSQWDFFEDTKVDRATRFSNRIGNSDKCWCRLGPEKLLKRVPIQFLSIKLTCTQLLIRISL